MLAQTQVTHEGASEEEPALERAASFFEKANFKIPPVNCSI